ncbi:protein shisa-1-like [Carassius carassius]|uniref:protein shisa-1-like n=1 Tax=Carassius carassius TaxID=217509 RepID=UPI002869385D|nr:protein shisa-1-like [Carassius carassius]
MTSSVSCALYLLVSIVFPLSFALSGEYCHGWTDSFNSWHRGFHCPERFDGEDARYCCGTCALRYCCTYAEARLDQSTCDSGSESENTDDVRKLTERVPTYLPFVIVVSAFLSFILVGAVVSVCCCQCVKPKASDRPTGPSVAQTSLLESGGPSVDISTPSRTSTSGSSTTNTRPPPSELSVKLYGPMGNAFSNSQSQQYVPPLPQGAPQFYQPYMNYRLPPEHSMLMAPVFPDAHPVFGQVHGQPFPQAPMHTEPIYPTVTI